LRRCSAPPRALSQRRPPLTLRRADMDASGDAARDADAAAADAVRFCDLCAPPSRFLAMHPPPPPRDGACPLTALCRPSRAAMPRPAPW
jgi:hypothetical protein